MEFTFATITYNHEKYILEHLNTIKHQVVNFGKDYNNYLIVSDDCSADNTVYLVENWLKQNKKIFKDILFIKNKENMGICKNYVNTLKKIKTNNFKCLAGDDIYLDKNIYELFTYEENIILTPLIGIDTNHELINNLFENHIEYRILYNIKSKEKYLKNKIGFKMVFETPGVFFKKELIGDKEYSNVLKYRMIEDVPFFSSILNNNPKIKLLTTPYIGYRINTGISNSAAVSSSKSIFDEDLLMVKKQIFRKNKLPKYLNPFRWYYACEKLFLNSEYKVQIDSNTINYIDKKIL